MSRKSRVNYSEKQQQLIKQIVQQINKQGISSQNIGQIYQIYKQKCYILFPKMCPKSHKSLKRKICKLLNIEIFQWTNDLNQELLNCISRGDSWKNIAKKQPFKSKNLSCNDLKQRFKFRILYKQVYSLPMNSHISDIVFKSLLNQASVQSYFMKGLISYDQFSCLKKNIEVFTTNSNDVDCTKIVRNYKSKQKIISLVNPCTEVKQLVDCIIKLNEKIVRGQKCDDEAITRRFSSAEEEACRSESPQPWPWIDFLPFRNEIQVEMKYILSQQIVDSHNHKSLYDSLL